MAGAWILCFTCMSFVCVYHRLLLLLMQYSASTTYICAMCVRTVTVPPPPPLPPPCTSFGASLQSIKEKLHTLPLLTQVCINVMYTSCCVFCTLHVASYSQLLISSSFAVSNAVLHISLASCWTRQIIQRSSGFGAVAGVAMGTG